MFQASHGTYEYRQQDVMGASPIHLIVLVYDQAIKACGNQDFAKATKAISILRDALDFDYGEIASNLFGLYQWCLDCIRVGDFDAASNILSDLREAWVAAENQMMGIPVQPQVEQTYL